MVPDQADTTPDASGHSSGHLGNAGGTRGLDLHFPCALPRMSSEGHDELVGVDSAQPIRVKPNHGRLKHSGLACCARMSSYELVQSR